MPPPRNPVPPPRNPVPPARPAGSPPGGVLTGDFRGASRAGHWTSAGALTESSFNAHRGGQGARHGPRARRGQGFVGEEGHSILAGGPDASTVVTFRGDISVPEGTSVLHHSLIEAGVAGGASVSSPSLALGPSRQERLVSTPGGSHAWRTTAPVRVGVPSPARTLPSPIAASPPGRGTALARRHLSDEATRAEQEFAARLAMESAGMGMGAVATNGGFGFGSPSAVDASDATWRPRGSPERSGLGKRAWEEAAGSGSGTSPVRASGGVGASNTAMAVPASPSRAELAALDSEDPRVVRQQARVFFYRWKQVRVRAVYQYSTCGPQAVTCDPAWGSSCCLRDAALPMRLHACDYIVSRQGLTIMFPRAQIVSDTCIPISPSMRRPSRV